MRGELTFDSRTPDRAAAVYASLLGDLLREARPRQLDVLESRVYVRGGIFRLVSNWNLLAGVTSATIEAIPGQNQVTVRYSIKVTELLVLCTLLTLLILVTVVFAHGPWFAAIAGPALMWAWVFGMNYLITRIRMASAFRRVAKRVYETESPTPAKA